jgi:hypothetical protein
MAPCLTQRGGCLGACDASGGAPPPDQRPLPRAALASALRSCLLETAPLLRCATLPARSIANFADWGAARAAAVDAYCYRPPARGGCRRGAGAIAGGGAAAGTVGGGAAVRPAERREARPPVEPLSVLAGGEFLHRPFDASEGALDVGGGGSWRPWLAV